MPARATVIRCAETTTEPPSPGPAVPAEISPRGRSPPRAAALGPPAASPFGPGGLDAGERRDPHRRGPARKAAGSTSPRSDQSICVTANVTSNGIEPEAGASVIRLRAPEIILNASTVTSLTGAGASLFRAPARRSCWATSPSSRPTAWSPPVPASIISGLQTNLGSDLQLPASVFLDASRLLRDSCAAAGGGPRSSFTRGGRGGIPPSPDRPLPSAGVRAALERCTTEAAG